MAGKLVLRNFIKICIQVDVYCRTLRCIYQLFEQCAVIHPNPTFSESSRFFSFAVPDRSSDKSDRSDNLVALLVKLQFLAKIK